MSLTKVSQFLGEKKLVWKSIKVELDPSQPPFNREEFEEILSMIKLAAGENETMMDNAYAISNGLNYWNLKFGGDV